MISITLVYMRISIGPIIKAHTPPPRRQPRCYNIMEQTDVNDTVTHNDIDVLYLIVAHP